MRRLLLSVLLFVGGLSAQGQTNMPYTGVDSSSACSGTLYDHAGPSGNYSNSAWGTFYLQPTGGTLYYHLHLILS